jgi:hypothetical protein
MPKVSARISAARRTRKAVAQGRVKRNTRLDSMSPASRLVARRWIGASAWPGAAASALSIGSAHGKR